VSLPQRVPNPFKELVTTEIVCGFSDRWGIEPALLGKIADAQAELPFDLWIFSGARDESHQQSISRTPFDVSTHADRFEDGCARLASGADVQPVDIANRSDLATVAQMGAAFTRQGLRWGGGARFDSVGIPEGVERWHIDLGPR